MGMSAPAHAQGAADEAARLADQARSAEGGQVFATGVAALVRLAHRQPARSDAVVAALTEFVRSDDALRRGITVDALQSLPLRAREAMVPVLGELVRTRGEGPAARLLVRGMAEAGAPGRAALRQLLEDGDLRGDAAALARMYLRQ